MTDALLLARIALIVKSLRIEGAGKKLRRKAAHEVCRLTQRTAPQLAQLTPSLQIPAAPVGAPPPPLPAAIGDDDDIFGDAGRDYVCAAPRRDGVGEAPRPFRFESRTAQPPPQSTTEPKRPPPLQPPPLVARVVPAKPPAAVDNEYDFYPGMAGSDDDEVPAERKGRLGKAAADSKPAKPSLNAQVADVQRVLVEKHGDKHAVATREFERWRP